MSDANERALTWTSEPPTVPGWYFTRRNRPGKPLRVMYVKRERKFDHRVKEWRYFMTLANIKSEDGRIIEDLNQPDRIWAGPIPEPGKIGQNFDITEVDMREEKKGCIAEIFIRLCLRDANGEGTCPMGGADNCPFPETLCTDVTRQDWIDWMEG